MAKGPHVVTTITALAEVWQSPLPQEVQSGLEAYVRRLLEWNARINLTGARTAEAVISEHLPDSFAMSTLVPPGARLVDVGSGGGLPAIPFAVLRPDCRVTLVEPRAKRTAFLRTVVRELGLTQVAVEEGRLEELAVPDGSFDCASSRATFAPDEWAALAGPLVRPGGRILVFTTPEGATTVRREGDEVVEYDRRVLVALPR